MDDILYLNLLRSVTLIAIIVGILVGLDLVLGARTVNALKRALERPFNFDKVITSRGVRIGLGIAFLILSLVMILLSRRI